MRGVFPETRGPWNENYLDPYEIKFWCFGGSDDAGGGGGSGLSDEDIDERYQQDVAAASVGGYGTTSGRGEVTQNYDPGFDPEEQDTRALIDATREISQAAAGGQAAVDRARKAAGSNPAVQQALANVTGLNVGTGGTPSTEIDIFEPGTIVKDQPRSLREVSNFILSNQVGKNPIGDFTSEGAISELQKRATGGDLIAADFLERAAARGDVTRKQADVALQFQPPPISAQNVLGTTGITSLPTRVPDQVFDFDTRFTGPPPRDDALSQVMDANRSTFTAPTTSPQRSDFYGEDMLQADIFGESGGRFTVDDAGIGKIADSAVRTGQQIGSIPGIANLLGRVTGADPAEGARKNVKDILDLGGTFDPEKNRITAELPSGRGSLNMNRFGMVTYSGVPDPSYTGAFSDLVNPPEQIGAGEADPRRTVGAKAPNDPCPAGYQLINGVCQVVDDGTSEESPDKTTDPASPTTFQPITQATPINQINPFILQPYTPQQAQTIQQARSRGIQALSPTGAALGRQI